MSSFFILFVCNLLFYVFLGLLYSLCFTPHEANKMIVKWFRSQSRRVSTWLQTICGFLFNCDKPIFIFSHFDWILLWSNQGFVCLSVCVSFCLFLCLFVCLSTLQLKKKGLLDGLYKWNKAKKRHNCYKNNFIKTMSRRFWHN